jgi:peptidoglycan/LPS O-acetylase OafA/YrhL
VSFSGGSLALQPFLLQQWSGLSWNYPSWSISTEAEAYFFFIFAAGLLVTGKYPYLMGAYCVAFLAILCLAKSGSLNLYSGIPALLRTLPEFSLGALLYRAHLNDAGISRNWAAILAVLLAGLAKISSLDFLAVLAFGCLIYYCVNANNAFGLLLSSRPSIALGNWSYSIYLWQAPAHYAVMAAFAASHYPVSNLGLPASRLLLFATTLAVVGLSAFTYQYFEIPARRFLMLHATVIADLGSPA